MLSKLFKKTEVKKNLTISVIGTGLAQVIHLLATPILTRLYTPEDFGLFTIFISIIGLLTSFSTLKYDMAIIICNDNEVLAIDRLIKRISYVTASIVLLSSIVIFLLGYNKYAYIFAFASFGGFLSARYWSTRAITNKLGLFKFLSLGKIIENSTNSVLAILFGLFHPFSWALILAKMLSLKVACMFLDSHNKKSDIKDCNMSLPQIAEKHKQFPKFSLISDIISHLNLSLIIFLFTSFYGEDSAGQIGLSTRVLSIPINFISISFLDVFRYQAVKEYNENKRFDYIFRKFFYTLLALALPLVLIIFFFGPNLFEFVFSKEWVTAGLFSKYLVILYGVRLIASPLSYSLAVNNKLNINLAFQVLFVTSGAISLLLGHYFYKDSLLTVKIYACVMMICNGLYLLVSYQNSKPRTD
jgi:O-antigen/teichoic acid export membrane protein